MKRFIDEFSVSDPDLMMDIIHALENDPVSSNSYSVEMYERPDFDPARHRETGCEKFHIKVFKQEVI